MNAAQFAFLARFLKERSGLSIGEEKRYLVEARLQPLARRFGHATLEALVARLSRGDDLALIQAVVEAMTTNETLFFRDNGPFSLFRDVLLPQLIAARAQERRIRIWSAACSTGQEPYSLAMTIEEKAPQLAGWRVEILATDLAGEVVDRARAGVFSQFEVQRGLPIAMLLKHFTQEGDRWRISQSLKDRVQFRTLNLLRDFSALGQFDLVLCRNVLIYFDDATKADVLGRIARRIAPDGCLMLGAAETILGAGAPFRPHDVHRGLFTPRAPAVRSEPAALRA